MPALHTAAFVSAGLLVTAIAVILFWLPAKAEAAAWSGAGSPKGPEADAAHSVHDFAEVANDSAPAGVDISTSVSGKHSDAAPADGPARPYGRHAAIEDDSVSVGAADRA
jgi:hypothetical protein